MLHGVGSMHQIDLPHKIAMMIPSLLKVGVHSRNSGCACLHEYCSRESSKLVEPIVHSERAGVLCNVALCPSFEGGEA